VPIRLLSHPYNKGYGAALKSGIRAARSPYVLFFDADGQHHPSDIQALIEPLQSYEMVVGRRVNSASPLIRRPGMRVLRWLSEYLAGRQIPDLNSGFRVVSKDAVERFMHILPNGFSFSTTITLAMFEAGYSVAYVPIHVKARVGRSMVSFRDAYKMLLLILRTITLFSPLKIFLPASLLLFLTGLALFIRDALRTDITLKTVMILLASLIVFFFGLLSDQVANLRKDQEIKK
jgi:glycosyltransferase involved in cell wall biosynthesis